MKRLFFYLLTIVLLTTCGNKRFRSLLKSGAVEDQQFFTQVPFEYKKKEIFIRATINGVEGKFMLDTGAPNVLSKSFREKLDLKTQFRKKVGDSQNKSEQQEFVKLDLVEIGGLRFRNSAAVVVDFSKSKEIACFQLDGLIGSNLMRRAYWQIDYEEELLTVTDQYERLQIPETAFSIPFTTSLQGTPLLKIQLGAALIGKVRLDTGSAGRISVNARHIKYVKDSWPLQHSIGYASSGIYGAPRDTVRIYKSDSIWLNRIPFTNYPIHFTKTSQNILGNRFFEAFLLTIDWFSNRIYLLPKADYQRKPLKSYGITMRYGEQELIISNVYEGSAAMKLGVESEDIVLEVNGKDRRQLTHEDYCESAMANQIMPKSGKLVLKIKKKEGERELEVELEQFVVFEE